MKKISCRRPLFAGTQTLGSDVDWKKKQATRGGGNVSIMVQKPIESKHVLH